SFTDPSTTQIYTLSLHDALPILLPGFIDSNFARARSIFFKISSSLAVQTKGRGFSFHAAKNSSMARTKSGTLKNAPRRTAFSVRSEEHTSELQSPCNLVSRLLLE